GGPKPGTLLASDFGTPVKPPRSSFMSTIGSSLDWWLKTNTHGRADHRFSLPRTTSTRMPASERPTSAPTPPVISTIVERERFSSPAPAPVSAAPAQAPYEA